MKILAEFKRESEDENFDIAGCFSAADLALHRELILQMNWAMQKSGLFVCRRQNEKIKWM